MDTANLLSNSRRVPPLPRGIPTPAHNAHSREPRPSIQQLNSFGMVRNPSQTSLQSQSSGRRNHTESVPLQRRPSRGIQQLPNHLSPANDYLRTTGMRQMQPADSEMANELLKIAREENMNLKDQNTFLLTKVRQMTVRQKSLKQTLMQYEVVIAQLTDENEYLKKEVAELTEEAKFKVEEFGNKLALLMKERSSIRPLDQQLRSNEQQLNLQRRQSQLSDRPSIPSQPMFATINSNADGGWDGLNQYISKNELDRSKPQVSSADQPRGTSNQSLMEQLNNQFQALIYSCRVEKKPEKRKQIRKRLVDLTYKMRALGTK